MYFGRIISAYIASNLQNNCLNIWKEPPALKICHFHVFENVGLFGLKVVKSLTGRSFRESSLGITKNCPVVRTPKTRWAVGRAHQVERRLWGEVNQKAMSKAPRTEAAVFVMLGKARNRWLPSGKKIYLFIKGKKGKMKVHKSENVLHIIT